MLPSEMVILMAIAITRDSGRKLLNRPMDISGEYVDNLYGSLVKRGYIDGDNSSGYQLTWQGMAAVVEFLLQNKSRIKDTVHALKKLGIDKSQEIDKLAEEVVKVE